MSKKGISVWLFSTLTFAALLHLIDSVQILLLSGQSRLFQVYPVIGEKLQTLSPVAYFWITVIITFIFWGITCNIAFENPVEVFLNKILSDAKQQTALETQIMDQKGELLDTMNETVEMNHTLLAKITDMTQNVRTEVKEIQPLRETMVKLKTELSGLRVKVTKIEKNANLQSNCPTCGKPILAEFKVCPYCGENIKLLSKQPIGLKNYR
ncbi:MAG: hypothetical protein PVF96_07185 [Candidatus Bathyarchaeota archaeon]